jgi:Spy/CpxP family protein refolding chaperone
MKSFHLRLLIAALAVLLGTAIAKSQIADAPPPMHGHEFAMEHMMGFFARNLDLTEAQQSQIKAILQKEHPVIRPLLHQLHQNELQLRQYAEGSYDEAKVRTLAAQQSQTQIELAVQTTRIHNELFQILTADQQAKMKEMEANHEARMQQRMQNAQSGEQQDEQ